MEKSRVGTYTLNVRELSVKDLVAADRCWSWLTSRSRQVVIRGEGCHRTIWQRHATLSSRDPHYAETVQDRYGNRGTLAHTAQSVKRSAFGRGRGRKREARVRTRWRPLEVAPRRKAAPHLQRRRKAAGVQPVGSDIAGKPDTVTEWPVETAGTGGGKPFGCRGGCDGHDDRIHIGHPRAHLALEADPVLEELRILGGRGSWALVQAGQEFSA